MKRIATYVLAAVVFAALLASGIALADGVGVRIGKKDGIGSYLYCDDTGLTLYHFKKDSPGKSACEGECLVKWPIHGADKVVAMDGLKQSDFGSITRADGKKQTTYKGMPIYFFSGDKVKGDTNGQGVKDLWFVVTP
jgi:predicted lipoprotein with Yx(FWY)xxD motif